MSNSQNFHSPTRGTLTLDQVVGEIYNYLHQDDWRKYAIVIGTDSQVYTHTDFVTAVVVRRLGAGGRYFWVRQQHDNFKSLRDRIYMETLKSLELAEVMSQHLYLALKNDERFSTSDGKSLIEIHVDVGQNGETRDMIREVVGMVRGNGYEVKIKPLSYAAFVVADHHT
ncbi:MAG: ribonuclease H-like YkuK family protein [Parcubacteria group bacterium]|nr:ribonuclease H-like YkuK family protein [Parcubacteria group bacterium]